MVLIVFDLAKHVEQEDTHIFVEVLVVEEELGQKGQIFAIDWVFVTVDLENCHLALLVTVDLVAGGVKEGTYLGVALELDFKREETEAEIAYVEAV